MEYIIYNLVKLLNIPNPTGNAKKAVEFIEESFNALGITTRRTIKGH